MLPKHDCLTSYLAFLYTSLTLYSDTHNPEQCVKATPNVCTPRHCAGLPPRQLPAPDPLIHPPPHGPHSWCSAYTM